jgi:hypothetical protein
MILYAFSVLGIFLLIVPWSPIWESAAIALLPESASELARAGWVRGVVSGLGALDLLVAAQVGRELWEAVRKSRSAGNGR